MHCQWDQISAVEVVDEELSSDSLIWARRFGRRYVLRPGPALRIHQRRPHPATITVSTDNANQAGAIAARHLAEHAQSHD